LKSVFLGIEILFMNRITVSYFVSTVQKLFLLCVVSCSIVPAQATDHISHKEIREIADICMYSQRILKDYALIGLGVDYHDPQKDLVDNIQIIKHYFVDLKSHEYDKDISSEVSELDQLWQKIVPELNKTPDKKKMTKLHQQIEEFSHRCEVLALSMAKQLNEIEQNVVLIAQLGMETQRLAALYMMKVWDIADPNYYQQVEEVLKEYEDVYHKLLNADEKSLGKNIKEKLKKLEKNFLLFKFMAASKSGRFVPTVAERNASKIFEETSKILEIQERLIK